jgi:tRNA G18 (ribose-2'-O)-methylase SpoU
VLALSPGLMARIAGFHVHRGVLAAARRLQPPTAGELLASLPANALAVVCIGIANHDNLGGVFRNAAAFAADAVLLDGTSCDPLYRKAIRVSVGAAVSVPFTRGGSAGGLLDMLERNGFRCVGLSPSATATLGDMPVDGRLALVLGAEGPGLPGGIMERIRTARIAMSGGIDSLNLATASGIALATVYARRQSSSLASE